jgi:hypothetical protein
LLLLPLLAALAAAAAAPPNLAKALEAQRALVAQKPDDAGVQVDLGNLLLLAGQEAEAADAYRRATDLDPESVAAHFNLGLLLQQRGEVRAAWQAFRRVLRIDPDHAWAHYQIGVLADGQGADALAIRSYARAFALDPRLRFSDVNPHVIDNRLLTEAMLYAYRHELPPAQPPVIYEEPRRIASILLPGLERREERAAAAAEVRPRPVLADPTTTGDEIPIGGPPGGTFSRVLDAGDLQPSSAGQATPIVGVPIYPGGVRQQGQPPVVTHPAEDIEPGSLPIVSTGRLELRLRDDRIAPAG